MLIERETEIRLLSELIADAMNGRGGAVLIEGEAGIGKTRLLAFARAHAESAGAMVSFAAADESDTAVPLGAARALLGRAARAVDLDGPSSLGVRALRGALAEPFGPGSRADEVVHALWWLISELADRMPLVLGLDDAHWADELTVRLLRVSARRAGELPLGLVVAVRPTALEGPDAVLAAERAFVRLAPAPLSLAGTGRLVGQALGNAGGFNVIARLRSVTRGNPLYLRELLDALQAGGRYPAAATPFEDDVPNQLVQLVADRLRRLPPAAADLARAIAVLGGDATATRARRLAELDPAAALEAEEILRAERILDAELYEFAHPVVVAAVRNGLGAVNSAKLHARAARLLASDGLDEERVAEHLVRATPEGDPFVVNTLRRAADTAQRIGAYAAAARLLERASEEPPRPELADTVRFELGRCLLHAGVEDGERILTQLLHDTTDASMRARCAIDLAERLGLAGRHEDAGALLRKVLDSLDVSDRELRPRLVVELASASGSRASGLAEAAALITAEKKRCTGQTGGERLMLAAASRLDGERTRDGPTAATIAHALLEQRIQRDFPGGYAAGSLIFWAMSILINADALDDGEHAMQRLGADAEELGSPDLIAGALWQHAQIAFQRGDLGRCELEARAALEAGGEFMRPLATPWLAMAMTEQNRLREAQQTLSDAHLLGPVPPSVLFTVALGSRGRLRLAQNDLEPAIDDFRALLERNTARDQRRVEPPWQPLLAEALALAGHTSEAAAHARTYKALASEWKTNRAFGHAARITALISPRARAITLLEQARESFSASHARLELARASVELGAHRRANGDRRQARSILRDAHDLAFACRANALCDRARAELLLAGGRPRPTASAGPDTLTAAERRIAEIAIQGATNREIARRLYVSTKTVEMHLHSIYRKLDITSRRQLNLALQQDRPSDAPNTDSQHAHTTGPGDGAFRREPPDC